MVRVLAKGRRRRQNRQRIQEVGGGGGGLQERTDVEHTMHTIPEEQNHLNI